MPPGRLWGAVGTGALFAGVNRLESQADHAFPSSVKDIRSVTTSTPPYAFYIHPYISLLRGRDTSVCIATRYGLEGPGIESRWGRDFPHLSTLAVRSTQPPIRWVPGLFRGVKRPGRDVDHPSPSSAKVEGRVELYMCSPSGPSWSVLG